MIDLLLTEKSYRWPRRGSWRVGLFVVILVMAGCSAPSDAERGLAVGMDLSAVRSALGEPDQQQEFTMPVSPFFGPQEALTGRVPAGSDVLEWQFERGSRVLFVWFTRDDGTPGNVWKLQHWLEAPANAVY